MTITERLRAVTLRRRVAIAGAVATVALALLALWIGSRFADAVLASRDVLTRVQPAADASRELTLAFSDSEGYVSDAVLDGFTGTAPRQPPGTVVCSTPVSCYERATRRADVALATVRAKLADEPGVMELADDAEGAADRWRQSDATPTFELLAAGDVDQAAATTRSASAQAAYEAMIAASERLQRSIDERRAAAEADLADFARNLGYALAGSALLLLGLMVLGYYLLRRWVLTPLDALRRQLQSVSRNAEHDEPITASGPPELAAAGIDAEAMRRRLVSEIDHAREAQEGLAQQGPVVAEIRAQLAATQAHVPGLRMAGSLQPAEGVLAGDFWTIEALPDGRAAIIVCDVSGHGPYAGVTALRVKNILTVVLAAGFSPDAALSRAALSFRDEDGRFATVAVAVVDPVTGAVQYANAGHHPPMLLRDTDRNGRPDIGEPVEHLAPTGPLLSALGGTWGMRETTVNPGDVLVAWTDGLTESHDVDGDELGDDGLRRLLDDARRGRHGVDAAADPAELVERVLAAARVRSVDWRRDDVTLVVVSRDAGAATDPAADSRRPVSTRGRPARLDR